MSLKKVDQKFWFKTQINQCAVEIEQFKLQTADKEAVLQKLGNALACLILSTKHRKTSLVGALLVSKGKLSKRHNKIQYVYSRKDESESMTMRTNPVEFDHVYGKCRNQDVLR